MRVINRIEPLVRESMSTWHAYRSTDVIVVHPVMNRLIFIGYNTQEEWHWYANIVEDVFYLMKIRLPEAMRGKGLGDKLYSCITDLAKSLGCSEIRQTPSGWTKTGETRMSYLMRRGWLPSPCGSEVFKELRSEPNLEKVKE